MKRRAIFYTHVLVAVLAAAFFISFAVISFADRASNSTYIADYEVGSPFSVDKQMNSTNYNVTPGGAIIGGQMNSSTYNVSFGILAGAVELTTTTTTTTTIAAGTGGTLSYSTSDNRVSGIAVDPGANVSIKALQNVSISLINFIANRTISGGAISVKKIEPEKLTERNVAPPAEKVYEFLEVNKTNIADEALRKVKIKFFVLKSWLAENNVPETQVVLQRHEAGGWRRLPTQKISSDDKNVNYESESPGLSIFAISVLPAGETPPSTIPEITTTTTPPEATTITTSPPPKKPPQDYTALIAVVVLILAIAGFVLLKKGKKI